MSKCASFFLPPVMGNRGREGLSPVALGHGGSREEGEKGQGGAGVRSPPPILGKKACREGSHGSGRRPSLDGAVAVL